MDRLRVEFAESVDGEVRSRYETAVATTLQRDGHSNSEVIASDGFGAATFVARVSVGHRRHVRVVWEYRTDEVAFVLQLAIGISGQDEDEEPPP